MKNLRLSVILAFLILIIAPAVSFGADTGSFTRHTLRWEGRTRVYFLYVPKKLPDNKYPLLFVLHGGGGRARRMRNATKFGYEKLADRDGFIVVYPDGVDKHWNDGRELKNYTTSKENVDDAGFIVKIIEVLSKDYNIDKKRVYSTGLSNGGLMSYRLAVDKAEHFAAVAPVIAVMSKKLASHKPPKIPVSILIMNGTDDPLIPYMGGSKTWRGRYIGDFISTADTVKYWVKNNGCNSKSKFKILPDKYNDGTKVTRDVYSGGKGGSEVVLYTIKGGGHTLPGGTQYLPARVIGRVSKEIDGVKVIWEFLKQHSR